MGSSHSHQNNENEKKRKVIKRDIIMYVDVYLKEEEDLYRKFMELQERARSIVREVQPHPMQ
jgi:hypothetical protein